MSTFRSIDGTRLVLVARGLTDPSGLATVPPRVPDLGDATDDERLLPPLLLRVASKKLNVDEDKLEVEDVVEEAAASARTGRAEDARGLNRGLLRPIPLLLLLLLPVEPARGRCDGDDGGWGRLISGELADAPRFKARIRLPLLLPLLLLPARLSGDRLLTKEDEGDEGVAALVRSPLKDDGLEGVRENRNICYQYTTE